MTKRLLFYGDSISRMPGYADLVCAAWQAERVNPETGAIGGSTLLFQPGTIACGMDSYVSRVAPFPADVLIVAYGRNDLDWLAAYYPTNALILWSYAWDCLFAQIPATQHVAIVGIPYAGANPLRDAMDAAVYNHWRNRPLTFFAPLAGMTPAMIGPDGRHPNDTGMQFIAGQVNAALWNGGMP